MSVPSLALIAEDALEGMKNARMAWIGAQVIGVSRQLAASRNA